MPGPPPSRDPGPLPPPPPVHSQHEDVVRVPSLEPDADEPPRRPHRVLDHPTTRDDLVARVHHPQPQIRVLPVRPREPLVEPAYLVQDRPPIGHVRRRPPGRLQPADVALPVGRPPPLRHRHPRPPLTGRDLRPQPLEIEGQLLHPPSPRHHVVVQERDPGPRGPPPPEVPGRRRSRAPPGDHLDPTAEPPRTPRPRQQRPRPVAPVVDQEHPPGQRPDPSPEGVQQPPQAGPPDRRHDDVEGHGRVKAARRTRNGPRARTSTGADPKHSRASRGSSTIGRPAVLRLVLTTTGTPVRRSTPSSSRATSGSSSRSTVWMRALPSTWTTAGMRSRQAGRTRWVNSMYGLGSGPSNSSAARSASTIGATGRNCSRPLTSLSRSRLAALVALASRLRWRSARAPYSERPWNQATTPSAASTSATASARSAGRSWGTLAVASQAASSSSVQPRPRAAPGIAATRSPRACATCRAAPRAVPASPAAGCTQIRSNGPRSAR